MLAEGAFSGNRKRHNPSFLFLFHDTKGRKSRAAVSFKETHSQKSSVPAIPYLS